MKTMQWKELIRSYDERRDIIVPGSEAATLEFSIDHFLAIANDAIVQRGLFTVALSGGSTPKAIFQGLATEQYRNQVDWKHVMLFWSDERTVSPDHEDSNYRMAMHAGFASLPILPENIFRMKAEGDVEQAAKDYEAIVKAKVPSQAFDLIMLGMGEDGHTASLFPKTHGLHANDRLIIGNFIPQKNTWRMTMTFTCINAAHHIAIYVIGKSKAEMVKHVFTSPYDPDNLPVQRVGSPTHKALWILDQGASQGILVNGS
jgi:6-phosphogluconolactonase